MYICLAPGLRLSNGTLAKVGDEIPEAKTWPHHMVDMHIRNGKLRYDGKPEHRAPARSALPDRPKYTAAERDRLAKLPSHQRELMAHRRGWPVEWLHEPLAGPEPLGEGVQLTEEQRQKAYADMPPDIAAMAAQRRGVSVETLTGGRTKSAPASEAAPAAEPAKKGKGR